MLAIHVSHAAMRWRVSVANLSADCWRAWLWQQLAMRRDFRVRATAPRFGVRAIVLLARAAVLRVHPSVHSQAVLASTGNLVTSGTVDGDIAFVACVLLQACLTGMCRTACVHILLTSCTTAAPGSFRFSSLAPFGAYAGCTVRDQHHTCVLVCEAKTPLQGVYCILCASACVFRLV